MFVLCIILLLTLNFFSLGLLTNLTTRSSFVCFFVCVLTPYFLLSSSKQELNKIRLWCHPYGRSVGRSVGRTDQGGVMIMPSVFRVFFFFFHDVIPLRVCAEPWLIQGKITVKIKVETIAFVIAGFHMTSLKLKLQNYWCSWDLISRCIRGA